MAHHEPLKALSPIDWTSVPQDNPALAPFLRDILLQAQTVINSIPLPPSLAGKAQNLALPVQQTGRSRSQTASAVLDRSTDEPASPGRTKSQSTSAAADEDAAAKAAASRSQSQALQPEWKEVKLNARDNPMGVSVYKLSAKDGRGAWFARRSLHSGMGFARWRAGLEREFLETLRAGQHDNGKKPGEGNVRGIGAEKRVERVEVDGVGKVEVYQLSAQFPGPASPRDFVTFLLTSDAVSATEPAKRGGKGKVPRQFVIVSKPCVHPACPQRSGFIRGQYESVEIIREVFSDKPLRKIRSSIDLSRDDDQSGRTVRFATAKSDVGAAASSNDVAQEEEDEQDTSVEWLMVTRSDPGGSVPRFMVEKGTPGAIVADAGKFVKWCESKDMRELKEPEDKVLHETKDSDGNAEQAGQTGDGRRPAGDDEIRPPLPPRKVEAETSPQEAQEAPTGPSGLYGMIAGALASAGSAVTTRLPIPSMPFTGSAAASSVEDTSSASPPASEDDESLDSFESADEGPTPLAVPRGNALEAALDRTDATSSILSGDSATAASTSTDTTTNAGGRSAAAKTHEKELRKLQDRYQKVQGKIQRAHERRVAAKIVDNYEANSATTVKPDSASTKTATSTTNTSTSSGSAEKRDAEAAKLREKHEKELKRQHEKYEKELRRLEQKRQKEEEKAAERARKQREKDERENVQLALEHARAERDVARKEVEVLKDTVGELQAQNTMLVAKLGKLGLLPGADAGSGSSAPDLGASGTLGETRKEGA
jgi:hypothetical protein